MGYTTTSSGEDAVGAYDGDADADDEEEAADRDRHTRMDQAMAMWQQWTTGNPAGPTPTRQGNAGAADGLSPYLQSPEPAVMGEGQLNPSPSIAQALGMGVGGNGQGWQGGRDAPPVPWLGPELNAGGQGRGGQGLGQRGVMLGGGGGGVGHGLVPWMGLGGSLGLDNDSSLRILSAAMRAWRSSWVMHWSMCSTGERSALQQQLVKEAIQAVVSPGDDPLIQPIPMGGPGGGLPDMLSMRASQLVGHTAGKAGPMKELRLALLGSGQPPALQMDFAALAPGAMMGGGQGQQGRRLHMYAAPGPVL